MQVNNRWSKVHKNEKIYLPTQQPIKIIDKNTQICSMGSCFADEVGWTLLSNNFNIGNVEVNNKKNTSYIHGELFLIYLTLKKLFIIHLK